MTANKSWRNIYTATPQPGFFLCCGVDAEMTDLRGFTRAVAVVYGRWRSAVGGVKPLAREAADARFVQDPLSGERSEERASQTPGGGLAALVMQDEGESGADAEEAGPIGRGRDGVEEAGRKKEKGNEKGEHERRSKHSSAPEERG